MENKHKIAKHNAAYEQGNRKFKLGLNKYGDMVNINSECQPHILTSAADYLSCGSCFILIYCQFRFDV
jgi:hypothetical protein